MSFIARIFDNLGARPSLIEIHGPDKRPFAGDTVRDLAGRARTFIRDAGVQPSDRVALLGPNSAMWVACDLAALANGAIVVPLYSRQEPGELAVMLEDSRPSLLVAATAELKGAIEAAWTGSPCRIALYEEVFSAATSSEPLRPVAPEDPVTIIYTSGTSGVPKGVTLSRANVDYMLPATVSALSGILGAGAAGHDEVFHFLPFCFAGSRVMLWTQLYRGNPLMLSTDLANLVQEMKTADPHYYLNVPAVLERIRAGVGKKIAERGGFVQPIYERALRAACNLDEGRGGLPDTLMLGLASRFVFPRIKEQIGKSLKFLVCGSAPLGAETQAWFERLGIPVYQVYGLTETTAIVTMDRRDTAEAGKVGVVIDGCETRLTDEGELCTRGPNTFAGYWNDPAATAEAVRDGWFHTGDQAELDERGRLRIIGRVKNILVPESGHNVAPEPLEEALRGACPEIEHAVVVGHGRPFLTAIVTGSVTREAVQVAVEAVNAGVPHYRKIRAFHLSEEPLTIESGLLTANQKLRRRAIEAHFRAAIEELYAK